MKRMETSGGMTRPSRSLRHLFLWKESRDATNTLPQIPQSPLANSICLMRVCGSSCEARHNSTLIVWAFFKNPLRNECKSLNDKNERHWMRSCPIIPVYKYASGCIMSCKIYNSVRENIFTACFLSAFLDSHPCARPQWATNEWDTVRVSLCGLQYVCDWQLKSKCGLSPVEKPPNIVQL